MNIIDCYRLRNMNLCRFVHSEEDNSTVKTSFLGFIFDFVFCFCSQRFPLLYFYCIDDDVFDLFCDIVVKFLFSVMMFSDISYSVL